MNIAEIENERLQIDNELDGFSEFVVIRSYHNIRIVRRDSKKWQGIIDIMEGKPESAEMNLLGAENIIENTVGMDNDYMKTTYRYLNNLYARWKKPEKAIEYRDKFLAVKQSFLKQLE